MLRNSLTILLFLPIVALSQDYSPFEFYHYDAALRATIFNGDYNMEQEFRKGDFQRVTKTFHYKGKSNRTEYTFNEQKRISSIDYSNGGYYRYDYLNDTVLSQVEIKGKKGIRQFHLEYTNGMLINTREMFKDELISLKSMQYDENGRVIHSSLQYPGKRKSISVFRVYEGDRLAQVQHYRNGKVVRFWDYSCKPEGEDMKTAVTAQVCEYQEESRDRSYIKYTRNERKSGVFLLKEYYSNQGTLYLIESFKNDTVLLYTQEINGYDNVLTYFKEDGSVREKTIKSMENNVFRSTTFNSKGKIMEFQEMVYNEQHQLISKKSSANGLIRKTYVSLYTYNSEGLVSSEKRLKGDKLLWESDYEYVK